MVGNSEVMAEVALGPGKRGNRTGQVLGATSPVTRLTRSWPQLSLLLR